MPRSMAAKQEQVVGLTTPRSKACLFLQASNPLSRSTVYIANWRFWELEITQMGRLAQLVMNIKLSKYQFLPLKQLVLMECFLTPKLLQLPHDNPHPS